MKIKKHTYYESDKKKQTETFAINAIGLSVVGLILMLILATLIR
tara:strand:+ start:352 stop:483 length:132 start_codon:yes stop_codon:yes gene_type:complete